jgi:aspartate ammonia-lyase
VKKALAEDRRVSDVALEETDLGKEELERILSPENLTGQLEREGQ